MMEAWLELLGRIHPLAVHLPIGIAFLLAALEGCHRFGPRHKPAEQQQPGAMPLRLPIVLCFAISAVASAVLGWILARDGGYGADLLLYHRISGTVVAGLGAWLVIVHNRRWVYGLSLAVTLIVVSLAGHWGASLTHGKGYMERALAAALFPEDPESRQNSGRTAPPVETVRAPADIITFETLVQPVLTEKCVGCHGGEKMKGDLRLDTFDHLMAGGGHGPVLDPGSLEDSELLRRLRLPLDDDDHMPPEGKPQLTREELRLIQWWVQSGASPAATLADLPLPPDIEPVFLAQVGLEVAEEEPLPARDQVLAAAKEIEARTGALIHSLHPTEPWLEMVARYEGEAFTNEALQAIQPIAPVIRRLDLGRTGISDQGLSRLKELENLVELKVDGTQVGDPGLVHLKGLAHLEYLNLVGTRVSDAGLRHLRHLDRLRQVYVWRTNVTEAGAASLEQALTDQRAIARLESEIEVLSEQIASETATVEPGGFTAPEVDAE